MARRSMAQCSRYGVEQHGAVRHSTVQYIEHGTARCSMAQHGTYSVPRHGAPWHSMAQHIQRGTARRSMAQCSAYGVAQHTTARHSVAQHLQRGRPWRSPSRRSPAQGLSTTQPRLSNSFYCSSPDPPPRAGTLLEAQDGEGGVKRPDPAQGQGQLPQQDQPKPPPKKAPRGRGHAESPRPGSDADGVDPEGLDVLPVGVTLPGAEVGAELAGKPLPEGVEPGHVVGVVEDEEPLVVVQEDPHLLQLALDIEPGPGLGAGAVLVAVVHDDAIKPTAGLNLDAALAGDGFVGQADHPLGLLGDHYLPVVDPTAERLRAQDRDLHVEAFGGVLQRLRVQVAVRHDGAVV